ncbi:MAG: cadmium-translocating P-type ATPase [Candidatus Moranbacteria bacterium]|nr:cadmium-translocating P-type ATPase [Candidatus Moranbacteria bacterium]
MAMSFFKVLLRREFFAPMFSLGCLIVATVFGWTIFFIIVIVVGVVRLCVESFERIQRRRWNLDYIAFLALATAIILQSFFAGAVIALMVMVSAALEQYGSLRAKKTLEGLFKNIPKTVTLLQENSRHEVSVQAVRDGDILLVRPHEMLAFDGRLLSGKALLNEANLTGELEPVIHKEMSFLQSGSINVGGVLEMRVEGDFEHSNYRKILSLVEEGKQHISPLVRLAERYNIVFTFFALALAGIVYLVTNDGERFLAVLTIATPCPLLIAAPLSFLGGLNKAARKNIVIKTPLALELLAKTKIFFFDKTGTLTLGEPRLVSVRVLDQAFSRDAVVALAAALEQHSFHPLAKAFLHEQAQMEGEILVVEKSKERIGEGIFGTILGQRYGLVRSSQAMNTGQIVVDLQREKKVIAQFFFDDKIKNDVPGVFSYLKRRGYSLGILTGDRKRQAERLFGSFGVPIYAECRPERKVALIKQYQHKGHLVGMVGDGMNDAPALALADVGIVFSGTENSASTEAADVAIFGRDAWLIHDAIHIGRRSYHVAWQSILIGIGLSGLGMVIASFGFISPVQGAIVQEVIDIVVIVNALRSTY